MKAVLFTSGCINTKCTVLCQFGSMLHLYTVRMMDWHSGQFETPFIIFYIFALSHSEIRK